MSEWPFAVYAVLILWYLSMAKWKVSQLKIIFRGFFSGYKIVILVFLLHFGGVCIKVTSKTLKQERIAHFKASVAMYLLPSCL